MGLQTLVSNILRHAFIQLLEHRAKKVNNVLTWLTRAGVCFRSGQLDAVVNENAAANAHVFQKSNNYIVAYYYELPRFTGC